MPSSQEIYEQERRKRGVEEARKARIAAKIKAEMEAEEKRRHAEYEADKLAEERQLERRSETGRRILNQSGAIAELNGLQRSVGGKIELKVGLDGQVTAELRFNTEREIIGRLAHRSEQTETEYFDVVYAEVRFNENDQPSLLVQGRVVNTTDELQSALAAAVLDPSRGYHTLREPKRSYQGPSGTENMRPSGGW